MHLTHESSVQQQQHRGFPKRFVINESLIQSRRERKACGLWLSRGLGWLILAAAVGGFHRWEICLHACRSLRNGWLTTYFVFCRRVCALRHGSSRSRTSWRPARCWFIEFILRFIYKRSSAPVLNKTAERREHLRCGSSALVLSIIFLLLFLKCIFVWTFIAESCTVFTQ